MSLNDQTVKYVQNAIKFTKRYIQHTTEPKKICRDKSTKLSIGQHITIVKRDNTNYYYFFYLGNQLFNLHKNKIQLSGRQELNYIELQSKDEYFNHMISGDLGKLKISDFEDLEFIYKGLNELIK